MSPKMANGMRTAAISLAALALIYTIATSMFGQVWVFEGTGGSRVLTQYNPASLFPVLGTAITFVGALKNRSGLTWLGTVLVLVFSGLFVFSLGIAVAPAAAMALISAVLVTVMNRREQAGASS